ncbi:MAG: FixH family protein [Bellilinea sp.]
MRPLKAVFALSIGLTLLLTACSGAGSVAPAQTAEPVTITMNVLPDPPVVGDVLLYFNVVDDQGQPVTGAEVNVMADHTDMSGMTMQGNATDQGKGIYAITTNFSMTGQWKIAVQVKTSAIDHSEDFNVEIR